MSAVAHVTTVAATDPHAAQAGAPDPEHRAWVEHLMGMPVSVHARGAGARSAEVDAAVQRVFGELRRLEAIFSTYRPDSEISRLQRGSLALEECSDVVREVHRLCVTARERTGGAFDAWRAVPGEPGLFDPTGLVKGWAVARASGVLEGLGPSMAVDAGGDLLVMPGDAPYAWTVGIEDPADRSRVVARVRLTDGAVATSGTAARGLHISDPRTGHAATGMASATVVGPSLLWADVFATAAVALGDDAAAFVAGLHGTSGLLVRPDGTRHTWANEP